MLYINRQTKENNANLSICQDFMLRILVEIGGFPGPTQAGAILPESPVIFGNKGTPDGLNAYCV